MAEVLALMTAASCQWGVILRVLVHWARGRPQSFTGREGVTGVQVLEGRMQPITFSAEQMIRCSLPLSLVLAAAYQMVIQYWSFGKKVELTSKNIKRRSHRLYIYINTHSPLFNISLSLFVFFQCLSLIYPQCHTVLSCPWWSVLC